VAVEHAGDTWYLDPSVVLSDRDLVHVEPVARSGQLLLRLEITAEGSERMTTLTAGEIGSRVAVIVDGTVRSISVIADAVRGPRTSVPIVVSGSEAERLTRLVRARWPSQSEDDRAEGAPRATR
jgi:preprotein translocase subunit SecD